MISPQICAACMYSAGASFWPRNTTTECFARRSLSLPLSPAFFRSTPRTSTPVCAVSARISMSAHPLFGLDVSRADYLGPLRRLGTHRGAKLFRRVADHVGPQILDPLADLGLA